MSPWRTIMAAALVSICFGSCSTSVPQTAPTTIAEILSAPATFDGRIVTVRATVRDTGVHGMLIHDSEDVRKGLNLRIESKIAHSDVVIKMTEMLLVDRAREQRLGVVGEWTGTFVWRQESISTLAVFKIRKLHWGSALDH
jgi:hypothetical protein